MRNDVWSWVVRCVRDKMINNIFRLQKRRFWFTLTFRLADLNQNLRVFYFYCSGMWLSTSLSAQCAFGRVNSPASLSLSLFPSLSTKESCPENVHIKWIISVECLVGCVWLCLFSFALLFFQFYFREIQFTHIHFQIFTVHNYLNLYSIFTRFRLSEFRHWSF